MKKNGDHIRGENRKQTLNSLRMTNFPSLPVNMLMAGCDIGSETHYIRVIDVRGRELSRVGHLNLVTLRKASGVLKHRC